MKRADAWLLAALSLFLCGAPRADVVLLKNGDRLTGSVERIRNGKVELRTPWAGTVAIDAGAIESVTTDGEVTVVMKDYSRLVGPLRPVAGRIAVQADANAAPVPVDPQRVQVMLPGRVTERDWRITGRVNLGLSDSGGNTEVRRLNGDGEVVARAREAGMKRITGVLAFRNAASGTWSPRLQRSTGHAAVDEALVAWAMSLPPESLGAITPVYPVDESIDPDDRDQLLRMYRHLNAGRGE